MSQSNRDAEARLMRQARWFFWAVAILIAAVAVLAALWTP